MRWAAWHGGSPRERSSEGPDRVALPDRVKRRARLGAVVPPVKAKEAALPHTFFPSPESSPEESSVVSVSLSVSSPPAQKREELAISAMV